MAMRNESEHQAYQFYGKYRKMILHTIQLSEIEPRAATVNCNSVLPCSLLSSSLDTHKQLVLIATNLVHPWNWSWDEQFDDRTGLKGGGVKRHFCLPLHTFNDGKLETALMRSVNPLKFAVLFTAMFPNLVWIVLFFILFLFVSSFRPLNISAPLKVRKQLHQLASLSTA